MTEFEIIEKILKTKALHRKDVLCGIGDDAAVLNVPSHQVLLISTDTFNEGTHFLPTHSSRSIGYRIAAANLSDMAAMGAEPAWITLSLSLPAVNEKWLSEFSEGFFELFNQYNVSLIGGDTTKGPLSISVTICGFSPKNTVIYRHGAKVGDLIYVTGTLGGTSFTLQNDKCPEEERLLRVTPRIEVGLALRGLATSAIDISDGFAQDLSHILKRANVGARIYLDKLPISSLLQKIPQEMQWHYALTGGEDYELCFTIPKDKKNQLEKKIKTWNCPCVCVGEIISEQTLQLVKADQNLLLLDQLGYQHF